MIVGEKVILRTWSENDLPALQLMRNNIRLQRQLMTQTRGNSHDQVKDWLATRTKSTDGLFFVIACKSSDQAAGYIQVMGMDILNGSGRLGICVAAEFQGNGYGGEAITLLEDYLRNVFRFRKLTLEVLRDNGIAIGMYSKYGYVESGCLREHYHTGAGYVDVVIMEKFI